MIRPKELKTVITSTDIHTKGDEEHVQAVTKHAVNNNMASSFEPNVLSNLFIGLHAKVDVHNSLLESISDAHKRFAELDHQLEVQIEMVSERPQGTTTATVYVRNATAVIPMMAGRG